MQNAPLHEILQGAGILEQQAINSILPANGQLEDTVIVRMLLHYAEQAYLTVKVAVLHPEFVARFYVTTADGAYEGMALLNDISDQNKASNYLYGVQQGFDVLLIPIHKRAQMDRGEHWMLGIYEASYGERQLLVCDPVDNPLPIDAVLRKILRHVLNTVVTNEKLKGCIVKPRNAYNHQDDASSCGVYIVFYARQYLSHRRLFLDKNFQVADERKQIYEFVVNSDQLNISGPSEAASFTSSTNMHALNIQDPMITPLRPTRAVKQRSKERISDILMELNASQREKIQRLKKTPTKKRNNEGPQHLPRGTTPP